MANSSSALLGGPESWWDGCKVRAAEDVQTTFASAWFGFGDLPTFTCPLADLTSPPLFAEHDVDND
jgi:hypothetical protein